MGIMTLDCRHMTRKKAVNKLIPGSSGKDTEGWPVIHQLRHVFVKRSQDDEEAQVLTGKTHGASW